MTNTSFGDPPVPLRWPNAFHEAPKRTWKTWLFGPPSNIFAVERGIAEQLLARPPLPDSRWGADSLGVLVGQSVCRAVQKEYEWPNDRFIPEDRLDIVCMLPFDDLEIVEVVMELEAHYGIAMNDEDLYSFHDKTLGEFVHWLTECVRRSRC